LPIVKVHILLGFVIVFCPRIKPALTSLHLIDRKFRAVMTSSQEPLRSVARVGVSGTYCFVTSLPLVLALIAGHAGAQEQAAFVPPKAFSIERYEAGWNKNPFTLKTAPTSVPQTSFAKDLAIASIYGDKRNPTVSIVNVKTHERYLLKIGRSNDCGIELKEASIGLARKDTVVRIAMGAELCEVHYDNSYLTQLAANAVARVEPAVLQLRQQAMQQQTGQPAVHLPTPQQQPLVSRRAAPSGKSGTPGDRQVAASGHGNTTTPSLTDQQSGLAILPEMRVTYRTGDESIISHPDPQ